MTRGTQIVAVVLCVAALVGIFLFAWYVKGSAGDALALGADNSTKISTLIPRVAALEKGHVLTTGQPPAPQPQVPQPQLLVSQNGQPQYAGPPTRVVQNCTADQCIGRSVVPSNQTFQRTGPCTSSQACAIQCPDGSVPRLTRRTKLEDGSWGKFALCVEPSTGSRKERVVYKTRYLVPDVKLNIKKNTRVIYGGEGSAPVADSRSSSSSSQSGDRARIRINED